MHDIDLIPGNYYDMLRVRHWFKFFIISTITIVVLTGTTKGVLTYEIENQNEEIKKLQHTKVSIVNKKKLLDNLTKQKSSMEYKLSLLNDLRNGPTTNRLFKAIDNAMSNNIWFKELSYKNSPASSIKKGETVNTGYFIIIQQDEEADEGDDTRKPIVQKILTRVEIMGQAQNHLELAAFVNRLNKQPEFKTVKIINTQLRRYTTAEVIDFTLLASTKVLQKRS